MLQHQQEEIAQAEERLQQLDIAIRDAQEEWRTVDRATKDATTSLGKLERQYTIRASQIKQEHEKQEHTLLDTLTSLQQNVANLQSQRRDLDVIVHGSQVQIDNLNAELITLKESNTAKTEELIQAQSKLESDTQFKRSELSRIQDQYDIASKQLEAIHNRLTEAERAFGDRSLELRSAIRQTETDLRKLKGEYQNYEISMQETRRLDLQRATDLQEQDRKLKSRERAFNQEHQDFEMEKKRFTQTKALHQ